MNNLNNKNSLAPGCGLAGRAAACVLILMALAVLLTGCTEAAEPTPAPGEPLAPTNIVLISTHTPVPLPTTAVPPTHTTIPPTQTLAPTQTSAPPTNTPVPPTNTPIPPADPSTPTDPPESGATSTREADGMVMVYIPAGEFLMGSADSDPEAWINEKPQHTVSLDAYWIDSTEVTAAQFRIFVQAEGYRTTAEQKGWAYAYVEQAKEWQEVNGADWQHPFGPGSTAEDNTPVVQVSWYDASAYCTWAGGSLPTEAQWEKAARGTSGSLYPWGDIFDGTKLNYCDARCGGDAAFDDGYRYSAPVGSYPAGASPYGALDMAGNVWEWTADRYTSGYDAFSLSQGPDGSLRVLRGGSWNHDRVGMRAAYRLDSSPATRVDNFGFRCTWPAGN